MSSAAAATTAGHPPDPAEWHGSKDTADVVTEHRAVVHRRHHARTTATVPCRSKPPPSHGLRAPPSAAESVSPAAVPPSAAHAVATEAGRSSFPVAGCLRRAGSAGEARSMWGSAGSGARRARSGVASRRRARHRGLYPAANLASYAHAATTTSAAPPPPSPRRLLHLASRPGRPAPPSSCPRLRRCPHRQREGETKPRRRRPCGYAALPTAARAAARRQR
uniref:Uncharacterized protein n=1 Tax=Oryza meridionalis TaxID=40149 RepID=A0A0E0DGQ8_9ORYZ